MQKYNGLLNYISNEYSILRGRTEEENAWKARLIYSAIGKMALASLLDIDEGETISIIHMKNRIEALLSSYKDMYPEVDRYLPVDPKKLSDEIYDIYLHTGVIYHRPNHILMSMKSEAEVGHIQFTRGYELDVRQMMSGLGTYRQCNQELQVDRLIKMFQLEQGALKDRWESAIKNVKWKEFHSELNTEYLRNKPTFTKGYWVDKPDKSGTMSLLRTGYKGKELYYLYKVESGMLMATQLPQWQVEEYNYRVLANACLQKDGVLPPSTYKYDGDIVYVSFGYLPGPAELYLWKLYSWPKSMYSLPRDFNRVCTRKIFNVIKATMQYQGYQFIEEK